MAVDFGKLPKVMPLKVGELRAGITRRKKSQSLGVVLVAAGAAAQTDGGAAAPLARRAREAAVAARDLARPTTVMMAKRARAPPKGKRVAA